MRESQFERKKSIGKIRRMGSGSVKLGNSYMSTSVPTDILF